MIGEKSHLKYYLLMLAIAVLAFWQVAFLQNCLKWDMIDVVLPFRYFAGECYQHGMLPMWNPYQEMGYPVHADLQCPVFYPETIIVGLLGGYSIITLHFLFIFYIFMAGVGMYRLSLHFQPQRQTAFLVAVSFMLSGFFTGHGQAMFAIIAGAWVPFVLLYYLRMADKPTLPDVFAASFFMFLIISNGYQTFTIILSYLLLVLFIFYAIRQVVVRKYKVFFKFLAVNALFLAITLLFSLPVLIASIQATPFTDRAAGIPLHLAMQSPLSPRALISLILPFATVKNPEFLKTDISMANAYFGILMLVFFIFSLLKKKTISEWLLLFIALFAFAAALGEYLPLRKFLYDYFPLMNLFRFPSYFSYFFILFALLLAGNSITEFLNEKISIDRMTGFLKAIVFTLMIVMSSVVVYSLIKSFKSDFSMLSGDMGFYEKLNKTPISEHIFIQSLVQLFLLAVVFITLLIKKWQIGKVFFLIIMADMLIATQLNVYFTVVSHRKPLEVHRNLKKLPNGWPIPEGEIADNIVRCPAMPPVWRNTGIFYKRIQYDAFSSFWLTSYLKLMDDHPALLKKILENKLLYLSSETYPLARLDSMPESSYTSRALFINSDEFTNLKPLEKINEETDSIRIISFNPVEIKAMVNCHGGKILTLLQSNYPGWQVYINGVLIRHFTSNLNFISVPLRDGEHEVIFRYDNKVVKSAFYIAYSCILIVLLVMSYKTMTTKKASRKS